MIRQRAAGRSARRLPQPIHHTHVAAVGGKLYMIGGEIDGASTGRPENFVADVWVHDPAVGGWVAACADADRARSGGGKAVIDGKIYVAGGRPPGGSAFEVYDPATDKWEKLPDLPTQRNHLAMVAINGKIIVAGGRTGPGAMAERVDVVEIYDPATRRWTKGAPLPAPRGGITGAAHAGCMFVFGGEGERTHVLGLTPNTYGYDPRADRWTRLPDLPIAVHGLKGSAVIGGRIFLPGGGITLGGNSGTNAMQVYRPTMRCESAARSRPSSRRAGGPSCRSPAFSASTLPSARSRMSPLPRRRPGRRGRRASRRPGRCARREARELLRPADADRAAEHALHVIGDVLQLRAAAGEHDLPPDLAGEAEAPSALPRSSRSAPRRAGG